VGRDLRRSRIVVAVLLVLTFALITIDYRTGESSGGPRGFLHGVVGEIESGVTSVTRPVGRTVSSLAHPNRYHNRADSLEQQNAALRRQLADQGAVTQLAGQLSALRLLADKGQYTIVPARVIAVGDVSGTDWTVTVNAGKADGLTVDKIVINASGLVGTVISLTAHTAVVRLFCDPRSRIGARLEGTQLLGAVAGGDGPDALTFTLYDASYQVKPGQRLVTFGSLDYVAGVPIGEVTKVTEVGGLSRTAEVKPFVSVGTLDLVGIVLGKPATDPGDRVLPPRPAPAAAAPAPAASAPSASASAPPASAPPASAPPASALPAPGAAGPAASAPAGAR
jgi:rod shape-determining protein MreC